MAKKFAIFTEFTGIDKISKPLTRMQSKLMKFQRFNKKLKDSLVKGFKATGSAIKWVGGALATTGAAFAGYVTGVTSATVESTALAQALGLSARNAEALNSILNPVGLSAENVADLMEEMTNKLGESKALGELGPVKDSLKILGLEFNKIKKLAPEQQFKTITNAALKMKDAQKAAAAADILMGGEANKIISLLRERGGTLDEIIAKQDRFNLLSEQGRAGATDYVNTFQDLKLIFVSLNKELSGLLGGVLSPTVDKFNEWVVANKDLIRTKLLDFVKGFKEFLVYLSDNRDTIVKWAKYIGIAVAVVGTLVVAVLAVSAAIAGVAAIFAAKTAIIVVAIGVLVAATVAAGAKIIEALGVAWEIVTGFASGAIIGLKNMWAEFTTWLSGAIDQAFGKVTALWDKIKKFGGGLLETVVRTVGGGDSPAATNGPQVTTPAEATARLIEQRVTNSAEVTIRDESGKAQVTQGGNFPGFTFASSGAF